MSGSRSVADRSRPVDGKRVVVTGAASGIGKGVATALVQGGARVVLLDRNVDAVTAVADELGATAIGCDVTDEDQVRAAMRGAAEHLGGLDGAVNNAGIVLNEPAESMSLVDFNRVIAVNLTGVFLCAREQFPFLADGGGSIVNTASMCAGIVVRPQPQVSYNASKSAVVGLTRSLAAEWADRNIRVNSVSPGYTLTELVRSPELAPQHEQWSSLTPMKRLADIDDLVGAYLFLLSDQAGFMTGQDIVIDGGYTVW
ncbi:SDR family oxidoreductase [Nakamurella flavida]|uniref:SDR family oxidoreductase n=1 Tax=Nakamurella flavida TaxID=363630 RepID=A0A938YMU9_9ACTN|nr:SDR family oxidoreductase [Nakamurella flavida]MBM9477603.1 SDR family oxidoreductase [Nakamurella flavida]MDP9779151.1 NAD(P)-dependent dehydrogenase (short-subunit alcohol dehydrogenase family) [Nakamurella flavida]